MEVVIRILASIRFLSRDEGGRSAPLAGGGSYRPNHNFFGPDDREMCIGFIELPAGRQVEPGDVIRANITLLIHPALRPEIKPGRQWRIQEGYKLVAIGTILEVLDGEH